MNMCNAVQPSAQDYSGVCLRRCSMNMSIVYTHTSLETRAIACNLRLR